jgi:hypothetical protein
MPNERSSSGYSRGSISEMTKLSTWTYTRYTRRLSGGIYDPNRTSFELEINPDFARCLLSGRFADNQRTLTERIPKTRTHSDSLVTAPLEETAADQGSVRLRLP